MRSIRIATLSVVLLVAAGFTAFAEGFSLELGSVVYAFNIGGTLQTPAPATTITSSIDISPNVYLNGSYTMKLDGSTRLKLGLQAEDMMGTISPSFVLIGRAEPYADLATGALTVRVSFPLYILGYDATNDPNNAEIGYIMDNYYKGISLSTSYTSSNTFLFTNYESVAYRLTFDKTTALVLSASTEIGLVPAPWLYDVKPQLSLAWGPVQVDLKESIYLANNTSTSPSFSDQKYNLRFYSEPRLTFDFAGGACAASRPISEPRSSPTRASRTRVTLLSTTTARDSPPPSDPASLQGSTTGLGPSTPKQLQDPQL